MKTASLSILFISAAISSQVESRQIGGSDALTTGVRSALFRLQQQHKSVFDSFGRHGDTCSNTGVTRRKYDECAGLSVPNLSVLSDIVNDDQYEKHSCKRPLLISGGGGFTTPATKKMKTSSSSPTKNGKNFLPPVTAYNRPLLFWENMICGAISRSMAQTVMHPANTMKTILQSRSQAGASRMTITQMAQLKNLKLLTRGAGAQFVLSVPHGAVNFAVLEFVRRNMANLVAKSMGDDGEPRSVGPGLDFLSSAISTVCCSIVSTPQMMITDNIMAGTYPNLKQAAVGLAKSDGLKGFYTGWWPGIAGKIPSYVSIFVQNYHNCDLLFESLS